MGNRNNQTNIESNFGVYFIFWSEWVTRQWICQWEKNGWKQKVVQPPEQLLFTILLFGGIHRCHTWNGIAAKLQLGYVPGLHLVVMVLYLTSEGIGVLLQFKVIATQGNHVVLSVKNLVSRSVLQERVFHLGRVLELNRGLKRLVREDKSGN